MKPVKLGGHEKSPHYGLIDRRGRGSRGRGAGRTSGLARDFMSTAFNNSSPSTEDKNLFDIPDDSEGPECAGKKLQFKTENAEPANAAQSRNALGRRKRDDENSDDEEAVPKKKGKKDVSNNAATSAVETSAPLKTFKPLETKVNVQDEVDTEVVDGGNVAAQEAPLLPSPMSGGVSQHGNTAQTNTTRVTEAAMSQVDDEDHETETVECIPVAPAQPPKVHGKRAAPDTDSGEPNKRFKQDPDQRTSLIKFNDNGPMNQGTLAGKANMVQKAKSKAELAAPKTVASNGSPMPRDRSNSIEALGWSSDAQLLDEVPSPANVGVAEGKLVKTSKTIEAAKSKSGNTTSAITKAVQGSEMHPGKEQVTTMNKIR